MLSQTSVPADGPQRFKSLRAFCCAGSAHRRLSFGAAWRVRNISLARRNETIRLKPGGGHAFTVPYHGDQPRRARARPARGKIAYLERAEYHGDPVAPAATLVVADGGDDICVT